MGPSRSLAWVVSSLFLLLLNPRLFSPSSTPPRRSHVAPPPPPPPPPPPLPQQPLRASLPPCLLHPRHAGTTSPGDRGRGRGRGCAGGDAGGGGGGDPNPPRREEPLHETILYMIRRRPWTTRLENSIRLLSPTLAAPLVHGVISGAAAAGRADLALQFFRFAYRRAGFSPEPATFSLLIPILASHHMLNHARCLLDTMPSFSIAPKEATDEHTTANFITQPRSSPIPSPPAAMSTSGSLSVARWHARDRAPPSLHCSDGFCDLRLP
uniref:Pentatricopeptide repeat-containing protein n=1 Tax=Oryza barthii TaxID=65489 RepID=A0A0D3EZN9_9ORYZ